MKIQSIKITTTKTKKEAEYEEESSADKQGDSLTIKELHIRYQQVGTFSDTINDIHQNDDDMKIAVIEDIRQTLLKSMYPLPHYCKMVAWILIILLSFVAAIFAIFYGLYFDLHYTEVTNSNNINIESGLYNESGWNNSINLQIEDSLSDQWFAEQESELEASNSASYGGSDSESWLLSIFQSLLLSLLLWQPLGYI